jgi:hypothetical protein
LSFSLDGGQLDAGPTEKLSMDGSDGLAAVMLDVVPCGALVAIEVVLIAVDDPRLTRSPGSQRATQPQFAIVVYALNLAWNSSASWITSAVNSSMPRCDGPGPCVLCCTLT